MSSFLQDPLIGREIDGYLIEKALGSGGMAKVYLGRDVNLERYVAIKVIQALARTDASYTSRFIKEAKAIASLQHPHIVNIYRFGEFEGLYYMAMQYIEGADLSWILNDYGQDNELMPHEDMIHILFPIASALDYAHAQKVIHRDIKPANIMLEQNGKAYLMDFGLALKQVEGTMGEIFGTPHYIAPEQAMSSAKVVPQSDQYALGVIVYELLTGTIPYDGMTSTEIAMAHVMTPLPSPLERNPDLSPALVKVLDRVLEKDPQNRYPTCTIFIEELEKAINESLQKSPRISQMGIPAQIQAFREAKPDSALPPIPLPPMAAMTPMPPPTRKVTQTAAPLPVTAAPVKQKQNRTGLWIGAVSLIIVLMVIVGAVLSSQNRTPANETLSTQSAMNNTPLPAGQTVEAAIVPSNTVAIESTLEPVLAPTQAVAPQNWTIVLVSKADETLYVINQSETSVQVFNLAAFSIIVEGDRGVSTDDWTVSQLGSNQCFRLEKNEKAKAPDTNCEVVGTPIRIEGKDVFWKKEFDIFTLTYGTWTGICSIDDVRSSGCVISIPGS